MRYFYIPTGMAKKKKILTITSVGGYRAIGSLYVGNVMFLTKLNVHLCMTQ